MKQNLGMLAILLLVALVLAACGSAASSDALTTEALQNAEYQTDWTPEGTVRLEDGEYRAPAAPGSASEIVVGMTEYAG